MSSVSASSLHVNLDPSDNRQLATDNLPHRPFKILYATLYYDVRPTFVVDITQQFEAKLASILAYKSQFSDQEAGKDIFPAAAEIRTRVESMAHFYGMLAGVTHAEPFLQKEVGLVDDLNRNSGEIDLSKIDRSVFAMQLKTFSTSVAHQSSRTVACV